MRTRDAVDQLIVDVLDVGDSDVPIAQDDVLIARCVRSLQRAVNWAVKKFNWSWRNAQGIEVGVFAYAVSIPADFDQPGENMALFRASDGLELIRKDPQTLARLINQQPQINNLPQFWCPYFNFATTGLVDTFATVYPGCDDGFLLTVDRYNRKPPTLVYDESALYPDGGSSFNQIPESIQWNVIIPYAARDLMRMEGDAREGNVWADVVENLATAWRDDVVQNSPVRQTRYGRNGRYR